MVDASFFENREQKNYVARRYAAELLDLIIHRVDPSNEKIVSALNNIGVISPVKADIIKYQRQIENFYGDVDVSADSIREYNPREIFLWKTKAMADEFKEYREIHEKIRNSKPWSDYLLKDLAPKYPDTIKKNFDMFDKYKQRKCGNPYSVHLLRSMIMAKALDLDSELWGFHDSLEDLPTLIREDSKKLVYGLNNHQKFLEDYVPEEYWDPIRLATNEYDELLKNMNSENELLDETVFVQKVDEYKSRFPRFESKLDELKEKYGSGIQQLKDYTFFEAIKEDSYVNLFLARMAEDSKAQGTSIYKGKGSVDLLDNSSGTFSLNVKERRMSILKLGQWCSKGYELALGDAELDKYIMELHNMALDKAREEFISTVTQPLIRDEHFTTALDTVRVLKPVFYTK